MSPHRSKRVQPTTGALYTTEFHREFDAETDRLLKKRFLWFSGLLAAYALLTGLFYLVAYAALEWARSGLASGAVQTQMGTSERDRLVRGIVSGLIGTLIYGGCFLAARRRRLGSDATLRLTFLLVVLDGVWRVAAHALGASTLGLLGTLVTHSMACAFLPWSTRQAVIPLLPVLGTYWLRLFVLPERGSDMEDRVLLMIFSPIVGLPGVLICMLRHGQRMKAFQMRFMQRRYGEVRRELVDARRIHEALFPKPIDAGPVRFTYEYEPMRQIGGDYLYACLCDVESPESLSLASGSASGSAFESSRRALNVVLMDVTGHGIPAALTVNRLYGELRRIYAEAPGVLPGEVLRLLNRYVNLTLADHSLYVTAMCVRVDPGADELRYASGGHPPAYVRAVDGTVHELPATTWLLGATDDARFDCTEACVRFGPGDSLVAYTDGVIESRGKDGRMLGMDGMRRLLATPERLIEGAWPGRVLGAMTSHRFGPAEDDALVIEVSRPVGTARAAAPTRTAGAHAE